MDAKPRLPLQRVAAETESSRIGNSVALRDRLVEMESGSGRVGERRRRIIKEATALIAERGLQEFSLGVVARRANTSLRTIYNAFENKENVIALSMWRYFEKFEKFAGFETPAATLYGAIDRVIATHLRSRQVKNYSASVALYFAPNAHPLIREAMQNMSGGLFRDWFKELVASRQLSPGVDAERLVLDLSNAQFSVIHEWSIGQLSDSDVLGRLLNMTLMLICGAVTGQAREHLEALLADVRNNGPAISGLLDIAKIHLSSIESRVAATRPAPVGKATSAGKRRATAQ